MVDRRWLYEESGMEAQKIEEMSWQWYSVRDKKIKWRTFILSCSVLLSFILENSIHVMSFMFAERIGGLLIYSNHTRKKTTTVYKIGNCFVIQFGEIRSPLIRPQEINSSCIDICNSM